MVEGLKSRKKVWVGKGKAEEVEYRWFAPSSSGGRDRAFLLWLTMPSQTIETLLPNIAQKPGWRLLAQLPQPLKLQAN